MRKWFSVLVLLVVVFAVMFIINTAVMDGFFDIRIMELPGLKLPRFSGLLSRFMQNDQYEPSDPLEMVTLPQPSAALEDEEWVEARENTKDEDEAFSQYAILPEDISLVEHLSMADKLAAISIFSKIDPDEFSKMVEISQDGITCEELDELTKTAEDYLTPSDIETLMELFYRNKILYADKK